MWGHRLSSGDGDLSFLWHREPGGKAILWGLRLAARGSARPPRRRGAQGRHLVVLRSGGVHRDLGGADPEDVDKMLAAYFEMARAQIEAYGGIVEKFIGDAVVGVFGVPAAHEDDPERAVRAGLRIVEDAEELEAVGGEPLRLRVGINTGEALVRLGVSAGLG